MTVLHTFDYMNLESFRILGGIWALDPFVTGFLEVWKERIKSSFLPNLKIFVVSFNSVDVFRSSQSFSSWESNTRPVFFLENTTREPKKKKPQYFQHFEEILWQESCFNATFLPWPHYFQSLKKMTIRNLQRFKIVVQNLIISFQKIW